MTSVVLTFQFSFSNFQCPQAFIHALHVFNVQHFRFPGDPLHEAGKHLAGPDLDEGVESVRCHGPDRVLPVERRADLLYERRPELDRLLHCFFLTGDHDLAGGVVICRGNYTIFGGFMASFFYSLALHAENGGHEPCSRGGSFLHIPSALLNERDGVIQCKAARGRDRRVFSEAVARCCSGEETSSLEGLQDRDARGEYRGLRVLGEVQLLDRAVHTELCEVIAESGTRGPEHCARLFEIFYELLGHAYVLRTLAGEDEGDSHLENILFFWLMVDHGGSSEKS